MGRGGGTELTGRGGGTDVAGRGAGTAAAVVGAGDMVEDTSDPKCNLEGLRLFGFLIVVSGSLAAGSADHRVSPVDLLNKYTLPDLGSVRDIQPGGI